MSAATSLRLVDNTTSDCVTRIAGFDDWTDLFREWINELGIEDPDVRNYQFDTKLAELPTSMIQFGAFKGQPKWEKAEHIPDQRITDALTGLIVYQGDTELASVEQQRQLFEQAPSEYDRRAFARLMCDEMRHGWQMSYLLTTYFGATGRVEAQKLLERRSFKRNRLLSSFNLDIENWLEFLTFTQFIDRDGKFQLTMFTTGAFAPLARSMGPMLREESFHLGTGNNGLIRIVRAGRMPLMLLQKYINKWVSNGHDLFGTDHSSSAQRTYEWGLKGRYDEAETTEPADVERLNERARHQYHDECQRLIDRLNNHIPAGQPELSIPDIRFNRKIGDFANQPYSASGWLLSPQEFELHLREALPQAVDVEAVRRIEREAGWIEPKEAPAP